MTLAGALIAESLRADVAIEGIELRVTKVARAAWGDVDAGQPLVWTLIEFAADDRHADQLAQALADALDPAGAWYCDFQSADETFVVFANVIFRYPRGDETGRDAAAEHARSIGVPESQLDWPD
jgi:hypothetical protein